MIFLGKNLEKVIDETYISTGSIPSFKKIDFKIPIPYEFSIEYYHVF